MQTKLGKVKYYYNKNHTRILGQTIHQEVSILIIHVMFIYIFIGCPLTWDR